MRHHEPVEPDFDPFEQGPEADAEAKALYEAWLEDLRPPDWFYPLVGEVASKTATLELCMTRAAVALLGTQQDPNELIKDNREIAKVVKQAAKKKDAAFDRLVDPFWRALNDRNRIVHAQLQWEESDGLTPDHWLQHHPRTNKETWLPTKAAPGWMTAAQQNIEDTTQAAFELTHEILAR